MKKLGWKISGENEKEKNGWKTYGMSGFNMNVRMKKTWMEKSRMSDL